VVAGALAMIIAAGGTYIVMRRPHESPPSFGSVHVETIPPGATAFYDETLLSGVTPLTIDKVPVGTRHVIRLDLAGHIHHTETVNMPETGGELQVVAPLTPITGKLRVISHPPGAAILINGELRGLTDRTVTDIDIKSAK